MIKLCDYGCGQEAKYQFKNGKWCCSENHKSCPSISYPQHIKITETPCPHCNKLISKNSLQRHIKSCRKFNYCLQCGKETKNSKFCSRICSGLYNNKNSLKLRNFQDKKIQQGIENRGLKKDQIILNEKLKKDIKVNLCLYCNKPVNHKFCNNTCKTLYNLNKNIESWLDGKLDGCSKNGHASYVKKYLLKKYNNKCSKCGWGERNLYINSIPLEVDHIDGNAYNNKPENVIILCPNCHSLTKSYRGANIGNGRRKYLKKYYYK